MGLDLIEAGAQGGIEGTNLDFEVQVAGRHEKETRIHTILTSHLGGPRPEPEPGSGGAIVYAARRRRTEELAERLLREGWAVGMSPTAAAWR